ncbi:MAG: hypothetical protein GXO82_01825, partial [Chlorobi bacterium]|nr:hypothetical protein [Chlorobiota bacterium]
LFAAFLGLFSFDVFNEGYGFWEAVLALLIHMIPAGVVLVVLAIAWRREWIGGILFLVLAATYPLFFRGNFHWTALLVISGPAALTGVLFLVNRAYRHKLHIGSQST